MDKKEAQTGEGSNATNAGGSNAEITDAESFGFRIMFVPLGAAIDAGVELELTTAPNVRFKPGGDKAPATPTGQPVELRHAPRRLVLVGAGYKSEEAARRDGERHRTALMLAGPECQFPVDVRDLPGASVGRAVREEFAAQGIRLHDNPRGLQIFREDSRFVNRWFWVDGTGIVSIPSAAFVAKFTELYEQAGRRELTEEERTALELFNLAHVDASPRARFLTFVSVVEALVAQPERSKASQAFLDQCIASVPLELAEKERDALRNALGNLKRESIGRACFGFIADHLNEERAKTFQTMYKVRSSLSHDGSQRDDLQGHLDQLRQLVTDLLLKALARDPARVGS